MPFDSFNQTLCILQNDSIISFILIDSQIVKIGEHRNHFDQVLLSAGYRLHNPHLVTCESQHLVDEQEHFILQDCSTSI